VSRRSYYFYGGKAVAAHPKRRSWYMPMRALYRPTLYICNAWVKP